MTFFDGRGKLRPGLEVQDCRSEFEDLEHDDELALRNNIIVYK
jgi:hypothetical protein